MTMTSQPENQSFGPLPPPPVLELTLEQEFSLKHIEEMLKKDGVRLEDLKTLYLALTKQNFCLTNSIKNLLKQWPTAQAQATTDVGMSKYGISLETKDFPTT